MTVDDIKLFPHNQETYNKIQEQWKISNKVATVQATGTGKTYLILKCLYNIINENKVVLAPSNYILEQMEREVGESIPNTQLLTYSRLSYMNDNEIEQLNPSLIVFDEFHRCGAEQWGSDVQRLINKFPNAKILGTSATNIRFLDNNRDMAEEIFEGNIVTNLSLPQAIVTEILPMPKYISALYTFENEVYNLKDKVNNSKNSEEEKAELLKEIDIMKNKLDKSKGIPQILKKYLNENTNDKFIIFCKNIEHLNEMKGVVIDWFKKSKVTKNVNTYIAYSKYNSTDKEVENFRNDNSKSVKLLFSIDMFNEGIHIEDVTGVILLRPTSSPIIYYQQIGRAIQVGKENSPLIFDFVNNFDNIGAENFINDLKEEIDKKNNDNDSIDSDKNNSNNKKNIELLEFMIFDEMQEAKDLFEQLEDRLMNNWDGMYKKLVEYKEEFGDCNIPRKNKKNSPLNDWVRHQRIKYNNNKLTKNQIILLDKIDFVWNSYDAQWENQYNKLIAFYEENRNSNVPTCFKQDKSLAMWVRTQRKAYINGLISNDKISRLEKIEFSWEINNKKWESAFEKLKQYKQEFGNCNVPCEKIYKDFKLGSWVNEMRKKGEKISKDRIQKLNSMGFIWSNHKNNSGVKGVYFDTTISKWRASITIDKKRISLGGNKNKLEAIKLRRDAEMKYLGKSDINLDDYKDE